MVEKRFSISVLLMLRNLSRQFLPSIAVIAATAAICTCLICVAKSHDHGPTPEQRAAAYQMNEESLQLLSQVTDAFNSFCENPDRETELGEKLITTATALDDFLTKTQDNPLQFVIYDGMPSHRKESARIIHDFEVAIERFANEIANREADPDFEINQRLYDNMEMAFSRRLPEPTLGSPGNDSTCFLCTINHLLTKYASSN